MCRQLGFPLGATSALTFSFFGPVPRPFSYTGAGCAGTETSLNSCPHQNFYQFYKCGDYQGAGVICNRGVLSEYFNFSFVNLKPLQT